MGADLLRDCFGFDGMEKRIWLPVLGMYMNQIISAYRKIW